MYSEWNDKKYFFYCFCVFLLLSTFVGKTQSTIAPSILENIRQEEGAIGIALIGIKKNKIAFEGYCGKRDIERNLPIDENTRFRIASISKLFVAVAFMQLYEQGKVGLDDDISKIMQYDIRNPTFPNVPITPRMLLSHTSSLNDGSGYDKFLTSNYLPNEPKVSVKELACPSGSLYTSDMWLPNTPGSYFRYCNFNFGLLATLIEKISGQRFDKYIEDHICKPLDIKASFNIRAIMDINQMAVLYRNAQPTHANYKGIMPDTVNLQALKIGDNGAIFSPQGGMKITAKELSIFLRMIMNEGKWNGKTILKKVTLHKMYEVQWSYQKGNGKTSEETEFEGTFRMWGIGFQLITAQKGIDEIWENTQMIGHSGDAYGLISNLYFDPKTKIGFVMITNGYSTEKGFQKGNRSNFFKIEERIFDFIKTKL